MWRRRGVMATVAATAAIGSATATAVDSGDEVRLQPNVAGKPSGALVDVHAPDGAAQRADEIVIALPRGVAIDGRARPRHCVDEQGGNSDCREDSQVGS